jgi:hypothetical protein
MANEQLTGYGSYVRTLGGAGTKALVIALEAKSKDEVIYQLTVSAFGGLANFAKVLLMRVQILKVRPNAPDAYPDPLSVPGDDAVHAVFDQRPVTQRGGEKIDFIGPSPVVVPNGQTYYALISAPYIEGDGAGAPSATTVCVTIQGRTSGGNLGVKEVTGFPRD